MSITTWLVNKVRQTSTMEYYFAIKKKCDRSVYANRQWYLSFIERNERYRHVQYAIFMWFKYINLNMQAYLVLLHMAYCALQILFFSKLKVCGNLHSASLLGHFFNSICSLPVSVSHFGNSHNISNFFIITVFVMVICNLWSFMLPLQKDYNWRKAQIMISNF